MKCLTSALLTCALIFGLQAGALADATVSGGAGQSAVPAAVYHPGDYVEANAGAGGDVQIQADAQADTWNYINALTASASDGIGEGAGPGGNLGFANGQGPVGLQCNLMTMAMDGTTLEWEHIGWHHSAASSEAHVSAEFNGGGPAPVEVPLTSAESDYEVQDWGPPPGGGGFAQVVGPDETS